jgi:hypothetical protein
LPNISSIGCENVERANLFEWSESNLIQVNQETFDNMFKTGILKGNKKEYKDWSTTINGKHYVGDESWNRYQKMLRSVNS